MKVGTDYRTMDEMPVMTMTEFNYHTNFQITIEAITQWSDLTCADMEAVVKTDDNKKVNLECKEKKGKQVSFKLPDGDHNA